MRLHFRMLKSDIAAFAVGHRLQKMLVFDCGFLRSFLIKHLIRDKFSVTEKIGTKDNTEDNMEDNA